MELSSLSQSRDVSCIFYCGFHLLCSRLWTVWNAKRQNLQHIYLVVLKAFSCAFKMFQGKSLRMTLYFKVIIRLEMMFSENRINPQQWAEFMLYDSANHKAVSDITWETKIPLSKGEQVKLSLYSGYPILCIQCTFLVKINKYSWETVL